MIFICFRIQSDKTGTTQKRREVDKVKSQKQEIVFRSGGTHFLMAEDKNGKRTDAKMWKKLRKTMILDWRCGGARGTSARRELHRPGGTPINDSSIN